MDIHLPDYDFEAWVKHLPGYFTALSDRFPSEVEQDTLLQEILATQSNDGELGLAKIDNGAEVLRIVQHFMRLALGDSNPPSASQTNAANSLAQPLLGHPIYSSVRFSDLSSQIRLVELLPGRYEDPIAVRLFVTDRVSNQSYAALSYVWGSRDADVSIAVDGKSFDVSANLAEALRCLRHEGSPRVIWIDAICINQSDDAEKSAQVAMMGDIYRNAADVLIFLGGEKDESDLVMEYLALEDEDSVAPKADLKDEESHGRCKKHILGRVQRCGLDPAGFIGAVDAFFKRPWWTRMWTVQEFALARREPVWCCGRRSISSPRLRGELNCLVQYLAWEANPGAGSPEIVADPRIGAEGQFTALIKTRFIVSLLLQPLSWQWRAQALMFILTRLQYRQSTDPRDYIYALREMLSPVAQHVLVPDYSLTADELFVKASGYLLLSEDRIDRIYKMFELLRSPGMPSWAVNFARSLPPLAQGHHFDILPDKIHKPSRRPAVFGRILRTSGVILDTLHDVISLEDASSDMEKLGLLWRAQGLLWHRQPAEPLPEAAKICMPGDCLLPLNVAAPNPSRPKGPLNAPATLAIPGFASFCLAVMSTMNAGLTAPAYRPVNLRCHNWKDAHRLPRTVSESLERVNVLLIQSAVDPEAFYGGACFDLDNLKAKIRGVTYHDNHSENPSLGGVEAGHVDQTSPVEEKQVEEKAVEEKAVEEKAVEEKAVEEKAAEEKSVQEKTTPDQEKYLFVQEEYVPQYTAIISILREAPNEHEFETLQAYLVTMADCAREIFDGHGTNMDLREADPLALRAIPSVAAQGRRKTVSSYREILENCTCAEGEDRDRHRRLMKRLADNVEAAGERLQPGWDQMAATLAAAIHPDILRPASKVVQTWNRDLCSVFTTRRGFSGSTFQRRACLGRGDVLAVLDGMPAPVVLEEVSGAHGTSYRMKALVHVHGMEGVDVDKLTVLGVCVRREFDIV